MMAKNTFMHPRNIYRTPLNFKELCEQFPELSKYTHTKSSGKVIFDFKDRHGLRRLTEVLLKKDFDLNILLPEDKLVPTLPLRLNYILWLEDLLEWLPSGNTDCQTHIKGIDIGTGASCIYPLLIAKKNGWKMLGTDIDEHSVLTACTNVEINSLQHLITVVRVSPTTFLTDIINNDEKFDFCMCNPPFFDSRESETEELSTKKNRAERRRAAKLHASGSRHEITSVGGEEKFIENIIRDSSKLQDQIRIYTVMVGCKASLRAVVRTLKEYQVVSFSTSQFRQGLTVRWAVAWTYAPISLKSISPPQEQSRPSPKPMSWTIKCNYKDFSVAVNALRRLLHQSQIELHALEESERELAWKISARHNTWTGLRRKRRECLRKEKIRQSSSEVSPPSSIQILPENDNATSRSYSGESRILDSCPPSDNLQQDKILTSKKISSVSSSTEVEIPVKRRRLSGDNDYKITTNADGEEIKVGEELTESVQPEEAVILEANLLVRDLRKYPSDEDDSSEGIPVLIQISLIMGNAEAPQQILQFIKNNLVNPVSQSDVTDKLSTS